MGADYRNVLGYLPQDFGYYPNYTAVEFLMYISALKGIPKNIVGKRAAGRTNLMLLLSERE